MLNLSFVKYGDIKGNDSINLLHRPKRNMHSVYNVNNVKPIIIYIYYISKYTNQNRSWLINTKNIWKNEMEKYNIIKFSMLFLLLVILIDYSAFIKLFKLTYIFKITKNHSFFNRRRIRNRMASIRWSRLIGSSVPGRPRGDRGPAGWGRATSASGTSGCCTETSEEAQQDRQETESCLAR